MADQISDLTYAADVLQALSVPCAFAETLVIKR